MNHYPLRSIIVLFIAFNGFFLASLITVGQLLVDKKSPKTWLFFLLFFILGLYQSHYIIFEIKALGSFTLVNTFPIAAIFLLGPAILGITCHAVEHWPSFKKNALVHFAPALTAALISLILLIATDRSDIPVLHGYFYNQHMLILGGLGNLCFIIYLVLSARLLLNSYVLSRRVMTENPAAFAAFVILLFLALALISDIAAIIFNSKMFMEASLIILNLIIIFLFLIVFKYPDYYKTIHRVVEKEKKRSYLKGIDIDDLSRKIADLIEKERIFTDEDLNLQSLAEQAGVTRHQLSEFMNTIIGENFSTYINRHRIEAAKNLLIQKPDENIISIAYEVGFKSKSTFNASFSKFEKTTPALFRKERLKNS